MEEIMKIQPDKERAKSLVGLASLRYKKVQTFDEDKESPLVAEGYYEVAKELMTAVLFIDGYKTLSHKELIKYIGSNYKEVSISEISLLDRLRAIRNGVVYYGQGVEPSYIKRNKEFIKNIISKLFSICTKKLK